ncbi:MAG TPA: hypothetical protein VK070_04000 [Acidimicrobiia bacterium]|nr:hypothetical protein [Acidimicrobiia bacterium]
MTRPSSHRHRYEVMFFLEAEDDRLETFKRRWEAIGDEVAVVGEDGLWNCHIHTDDVGAAVEAGIEAGRPRRIRVTDLHVEMGELEADVAAGGFSPLSEVLDSKVGVLAVCDGAGLVERFRRAGVQHVVAGRYLERVLERMVEATEEAPAEVVVLLPNDRLLVPMAEAVDGLTTKEVHVVPTRSVVQGLAAMLAYRPGVSDVESLLDDMAVAAGAVEHGEVVQADRSARTDGWVIAPGDWLGIADGKVVVVDRDRFSVLRGLVAAILPAQAHSVTVYRGEHGTQADVKALEAWMSDTHPGVVVVGVDGSQPVQPYLVSVE